MTSGTITLDSATLLAEARRARAEENAAATRVLVAAVEWARLHQVGDEAEAATWPGTAVLLGGQGSPLVASHAVAEFAAAIGVSTGSGRALIAEGLELAHRMPRLWARVLSGQVVAWKARRVAAQTTHLTPEAIAYVDAQVAPFVRGMGAAAVQRVLDAAINQYMPEEAERRRQAAADGRHVTVNTDQVTFDGTTTIYGELDLADAIDFDNALNTGAAQLADLGNTEPHHVRRSLALGEMSRTQPALPLHTTPTSLVPTRAAGSSLSNPPPVEPVETPPRSRDLTLYVHLTPEGTATLENHGPTLLTAEQVRTWCANPEARITIRPIIDLATEITSPGYVPSDRLREQVIARDRTCVFPHCEHQARTTDLDHIKPYDPDGAGGQTTSSNLACLCRQHHRLKTFHHWTYTQLEPGVFLWRSPHGYQYLRDRHGTRDITPRPVDPPG